MTNLNGKLRQFFVIGKVDLQSWLLPDITKRKIERQLEIVMLEIVQKDHQLFSVGDYLFIVSLWNTYQNLDLIRLRLQCPMSCQLPPVDNIAL